MITDGSDRSFLNMSKSRELDMSKSRELEHNTSYIGAETDIQFSQYMLTEEKKEKQRGLQKNIDNVVLVPKLNTSRPGSSKPENQEKWATTRDKLDTSGQLTTSND